MKRKLFLCITLCSSLWIQAQVIAEIKNISFYEHHSTDMTGETFGNSANGSKSGYDFVQRRYFNSFNTANNGKYLNGEEKNLDMVEHGSAFGSNGSSMYLGFTSGVSSIWAGDIKGNGTTKWHKVAGGVTVYDNLKNYTDLKSGYNAAMATDAVDEVKKDEVYIGRIRNTGLYVMIRCTSIKLLKGQQGIEDNSAFVFDYKFGSETGVTGVQDLAPSALHTYPNPVQGILFIETIVAADALQQIILLDMTGKQITLPEQSYSLNNNTIELNTDFLPEGLYKLMLKSSSNTTYTGTFLKAGK